MEIREERGKLTPRVIVDVARDPDHPLHNRFEWDNSVAAEKYRLHQAGELVRSVEIKYQGSGGDLRKVRGFSSITRENTPEMTYEPTEEVLENPITAKILLNQLRRDWMSFKQRYEHMREFRDIILADLDGDSA